MFWTKAASILGVKLQLNSENGGSIILRKVGIHGQSVRCYKREKLVIAKVTVGIT
jgi:hypothetical protein